MLLCCMVFLLPGIVSCRKGWLDEQPDKRLVVPKSIGDYQALLDNTSQIFNFFQSCGLGEIAAGDFYVLYSSWQALYANQERMAYIWGETAEFYNGEKSSDWESGYKRVLSANIVLDGIEKIRPDITQQEEWNQVKGSALFFRSFDFFSMAQEYCNAYVPATAASMPGLPLRLEYDVELKVGRSTLEQTYERIIADTRLSANLLGTKPGYKTRPSKQAAFGLLARIYLVMEDYRQAALYADSALQIQSGLLKFSSLRAGSAFPFPRFNEEVLFHNTFSYGIFNASRLLVEPALYASYTDKDLRKSLYFNENAKGASYKGSYSGDRTLFGGLAIDELYLIRAECLARKGEGVTAMDVLNALLVTRFKEGYKPLKAKNGAEALALVLAERRKELVFRGIRWSDLRRLNRDDRFKVTLKRELNGKTYILPPGDKKYVFPIDEIELKLSGIAQNER